MYDHVHKEIPDMIKKANLPIDVTRASILGHSMGGHGALVLYLREPNSYRAASAFAPISHPTNCDVGKKLIQGYLEGGLEEGQAYDASLLLSKVSSRKIDILVDCGLNDNFYKDKTLQPESLIEAAKKSGLDESQVQVRLHEGYDHSYYFVSTFAADHVHWHAKFLK
ncbi:S-formylglutathione hydrolase [Malassezia pachydermatis]